jgi:hypothetical protein
MTHTHTLMINTNTHSNALLSGWVGVHRNRYEYTENLYNLRASRDEFNDRVIEPQISVHEQIAAAARKNKGGDQDMKVCVHVCACVCVWCAATTLKLKGGTRM